MAEQQNPTELDFPLPLKGVYQTSAYHRVPEGFSVHANNVIAYDTGGRARVGVRPGTTKYFPTSGTNALNFGNGTNGAWIQYMGQVNVQDTTAGTTGNKLVIVSGGRAYVQLPTDTVLNRIDGGGAATFSAARRVSHVVFQNVSYFTDGLTVQKYDHATSTFGAWAATAGTFPIQNSRYPRYLALWRGRIVMAYMEKGSPGLWFMSAMNGPTDFDYGSTNGASIAIASNSNYKAGQMGDQVNALIPANEDVLYFGMDHSLYKMTGDPGAGGSLVPVSETVGVLNNDAWCMVGTTLYFMSNVGMCRLPLGGEIEVVSDVAYKDAFKDLPQIGYYIELEYDAKRSLIWVFVTMAASPFTTSHVAYDLRAERLYGTGAGFWPQSFPVDTGGDDLLSGTTAPRHGPTKACVFDGGSGTSSARLVLLGGRDGYIRKIDETKLSSDDGTAVASEVWLGPLQPAGATQTFMINGWVPVLGEDANTNVDWTLQGGADPYTAYAAPTETRTGGTDAGGRQGVLGDRMTVNTAWLKFSYASGTGNTYSIERVTARVGAGGPQR